MNEQELHHLVNLVKKWRQEKISTGDAQYDTGVDNGYQSCADELEDFLHQIKQQKIL